MLSIQVSLKFYGPNSMSPSQSDQTVCLHHTCRPFNETLHSVNPLWCCFQSTENVFNNDSAVYLTQMRSIYQLLWLCDISLKSCFGTSKTMHCNICVWNASDLSLFWQTKVHFLLCAPFTFLEAKIILLFDAGQQTLYDFGQILAFRGKKWFTKMSEWVTVIGFDLNRWRYF